MYEMLLLVKKDAFLCDPLYLKNKYEVLFLIIKHQTLRAVHYKNSEYYFDQQFYTYRLTSFTVRRNRTSLISVRYSDKVLYSDKDASLIGCDNILQMFN